MTVDMCYVDVYVALYVTAVMCCCICCVVCDGSYVLLYMLR